MKEGTLSCLLQQACIINNYTKETITEDESCALLKVCNVFHIFILDARIRCEELLISNI